MSSCQPPFRVVNFFDHPTAKRGEAKILRLFFFVSSSIPKLTIGILKVCFFGEKKIINNDIYLGKTVPT